MIQASGWSLPAGRLDFGHIYADFPDGRRQVPVLIPTWSFSNFAFAISLPTERTEAVLAGMVAGFEFFGCVAREAWWDNPRTVATRILRGRERRMNVRYAALASLLITSNLAFGDWGQVFQGERMTAALLDRLTHRCHIFEMNGESYRFRESLKAGKRTRATSTATEGKAAEPKSASTRKA